jgi:hypothetical protein
MFVVELQLLWPHVVPVCHSRHAPAPSQVPSRLHVDFASGPQDGCPVAGMLPAGTSVHVPTLFGRLQARHVSPLQSWSQHTPSTQKPLAQSLGAAHEAPFCCGMAMAMSGGSATVPTHCFDNPSPAVLSQR